MITKRELLRQVKALEKRLDEVESRARSNTMLYHDAPDPYVGGRSYHSQQISVSRVCRMILNHFNLSIDKVPSTPETFCLAGKED